MKFAKSNVCELKVAACDSATWMDLDDLAIGDLEPFSGNEGLYWVRDESAGPEVLRCNGKSHIALFIFYFNEEHDEAEVLGALNVLAPYIVDGEKVELLGEDGLTYTYVLKDRKWVKRA